MSSLSELCCFCAWPCAPLTWDLTWLPDFLWPCFVRRMCLVIWAPGQPHLPSPACPAHFAQGLWDWAPTGEVAACLPSCSLWTSFFCGASHSCCSLTVTAEPYWILFVVKWLKYVHSVQSQLDFLGLAIIWYASYCWVICGGSVLCNTILYEQLGGAAIKLLFQPLFLCHPRQ